MVDSNPEPADAASAVIAVPQDQGLGWKNQSPANSQPPPVGKNNPLASRASW